MDLPSITGDLMGYLPWFHVLDAPWCWYIYLHDWMIFRAHVMVNIPYMEHHLINNAFFSAMFDYYRRVFQLGELI